MNDLQTFETRTATVCESATVQNPFGAPLAQGGASNISTAQIVSREVAEMQAQIYLAKQFPRDQRQATDRILTACQRPGLASVAVYVYPRGSSNVSGPSFAWRRKSRETGATSERLGPRRTPRRYAESPRFRLG